MHRKELTTTKKILLIIIALLISVSVASAETCYVLCNPDSFVNVRMSPSVNGIEVGMFDCGDSFETDMITKTDKHGRVWLHVINAHLESVDAWICKSYVQDTNVTVEKAMATVVAKGKTAIRKTPNGKRNKWVKNGDDIEIYAYSEEWALTKSGFISMDCIEVWYE